MPILKKEISKAIRGMLKGKAPGLDGIYIVFNFLMIFV